MLIIGSAGSSRAHVGRPCWSGWVPPPSVGAGARSATLACAATYAVSGPVSSTPVTRSALVKARRRSAFARQSGSTCRCTPRPGRRRRGSGIRPGTAASTSATTRSNMEAGARSRQPTHVRTGIARRTTAEVYPAYGPGAGGGVGVTRPRRGWARRWRRTLRRPLRCRVEYRSATR